MSIILRRFVTQNVVRNMRKSSDYAPANFKKLTMDDLPVPSGSWQENFNQQQAKYNKHLFLGATFFVFTMIVCKASGLIYLNMSPPPYPYPDKE